MKHRHSLQRRITVLCGFLLALCCVVLTAASGRYAWRMADSIEAAAILRPDSAGETDGWDAVPQQKLIPAESGHSQVQAARQNFRVQSLLTMSGILIGGCLLISWVTGRALRPLRELEFQIRQRTADNLGEELPVPDSRDEVSGLTVSFNEMSRNLHEAFEQQKRFSQSAAHELRTPLTILKTKVAVFRKKGDTAPEATAEMLDVVERQIDRLSKLVKDLLELTNMDAVPMEELVSVESLLEGVAEELSDLAAERDVVLRVQPMPACLLRGNESLLRRAFFNLMENAVNYNRTGGTVTVSAELHHNTAHIELSDQGIGIPRELRTQIFEPFFRVDKSRSRQLGGAGLGLSLVDSIIKLHHGTIRVEENQTEPGSCFVVELPAAGGGQP